MAQFHAANIPMRDRMVGDIAAKLAGATAVFRAHKIDFCCGGGVSLAEAAATRGKDLGTIEAALAVLAAAPPEAPTESVALIDHILSRFHETHRREMPELVKLAKRVESVHRDHPRVPAGLATLLEKARSELEDHMAKEEQVLFPAMRAGYPGSLDMPIHVMRHEHDHHAQTIRALEAMTDGFVPPDGACRSWQALYAGVGKLVSDLMEHIHLENNVLFPRFQKAGRS